MDRWSSSFELGDLSSNIFPLEVQLFNLINDTLLVYTRVELKIRLHRRGIQASHSSGRINLTLHENIRHGIA